jgi:CheY-like chemotaxis protein
MSQTRILIIDDDIRMESVMKRFLFEKKYTLTFANDGKQGVEKATNLQPDIILCDIVMPAMDGFQVLQHLRENPLSKPPIFIFLSAKATTDDFLLGISKGADGYLAKPISRNDLVETIESHTFQQSFK